MLKVPLDSIMSNHVITIKDDATVSDAAHLLLRYRINGIVVVKKDNPGEVLGVMTTASLIKLLDRAMSRPRGRANALARIAGMRLNDVPLRQVIKVPLNTSTVKVIATMHRKQMYTILVYEKERLVGVVGIHDILNAAFGA